MGEELYLLTQNLYTYRAFIDESSFEMLHRYKRVLQDAKVLLNRITRFEYPEEPETLPEISRVRNWEAVQQAQKTRYQECTEELNSIYAEVDDLYFRITKSIKEHIGAVLER